MKELIKKLNCVEPGDISVFSVRPQLTVKSDEIRMIGISALEGRYLIGDKGIVRSRTYVIRSAEFRKIFFLISV